MSKSGQEEDKKPAEQFADYITLKVLAQDGNAVFVTIKRSAKLQKLMDFYCERQSVVSKSVVFLLDGRRLRGEQTPEELELKHGDEIDAMLHQDGGAVAM